MVVRLDKYLVDEGYFESRNRANDAIKAGLVLVDGKKGKPSLKINENSMVEVEESKFYVSRAARKLENFLTEHPVEMKGKQSEEAFELVTCDVSFISILQIIGDIDRLAQRGADIVILYKPQFEVGKDAKRDSKGVVQDMDAIARRKEAFEAEAETLGWDLKHQAKSKVSGKEGNREYLYHFKKK